MKVATKAADTALEWEKGFRQPERVELGNKTRVQDGGRSKRILKGE